MGMPELCRKARTTFHLEMTAHCIRCRRRIYPVSNIRHRKKCTGIRTGYGKSSSGNYLAYQTPSYSGSMYAKKEKEFPPNSDEVRSWMLKYLDDIYATEEGRRLATELYLSRIRGQPFLSNGREPRTIAAAIVYLTVVVTKEYELGRRVTQEDFGIAGVTMIQNIALLRREIEK